MPIHYGDSKKVKEVYFGSNKIKEIYRGSDLVWKKSDSNVFQLIDPTDATSQSTYNVSVETQLLNELTRRGLSKSTTEIPFRIDLSRTKTVSSLFYNYANLTKVPDLINAESVTDITSLFNGCSSLTSVPELRFPNATKANQAFANCSALTSVGPIRFNLADVDFTNIFYQCNALQEDKTFLSKTNWWQWWDSAKNFTNYLGRTFNYPPFYDSALNHIPYAYNASNTTTSVVTRTITVPPWAKFANLFLVSAGRAGQNGNGGNAQSGLGGGTAGMFIQSNIPVTASSVVRTELEKRSVSVSGSHAHPPNTEYSYVHIDGVRREAIGSRLQNSGASTTQTGSTIDYVLPGNWTPKGLLIGMYDSSKSGQALGWSVLNGESNLALGDSPNVSLQNKITTGPPGYPSGGSGLFGAGGAGGNGGVFNNFSLGGYGGPATVRLVFSPINSNDW